VSRNLRDLIRPVALLGVAGIVVLGVTACGDDSGAGTTSGSKSSSGTPLVGTNWVLSDGDALGTPITGVTVSIRFDQNGRVSGESGCNSYNAAYTTSGSKMTIGPDIATTLRQCEGAADAVERAYLALLPKVQRSSITGTTLTLLGASDRKLLVYSSSSGPDALSGHWEATSYYTGNAIQSVIIGTTLTADFSKTTISGDAGCNLYNGPYTTSGTDTIAIGPLASTLRACADPAVGVQEQQYLAALQLSKRSRVTGDRLDLLRDGGTIAATFTRTK
jgi:heat shock protein HslJ